MTDCKNYRGITLLSTAPKILNKVILDRIKDAVDARLRDNQAGFRSNRSCLDQILTLSNIVEQSVEWNTSLYIKFIDFEKAFDSMDRSTIWDIMRHYGIPEKIAKIVESSYQGMSAKLLFKQRTSKSFRVKTGVRQGCLLSLLLFLLVIDCVMKKVVGEGENGIKWVK